MEYRPPRRPQRSIPELNAQFDEARAEIRSKYEEKMRILIEGRTAGDANKEQHEEKMRILKGQMARETNELIANHEKDVTRVTQYELREGAGTLGEEHACGTCGARLERDPSNPDDLDHESAFYCELGRFCAFPRGSNGWHCIAHKVATTTCGTCQSDYCERCVESVEKCALCWSADILTCGHNCDLETMPCGELACNEHNCKYYHYRRCNCED